MITVLVPSALRADSEGAASVQVEARERDALGDVLDRLFEVHPALRRRVLDDAGELRRYVNVFVGDDEARGCGGLAADVPDGQVVHILPSVAGGA